MSKRRPIPDTVQDLVGDAMSKLADEAAAEAAARHREAERLEFRARRVRVAAAILLPVCIALTSLNVAGFRWLGGGDPPAPRPDETRADALVLLRDAVEELELAHESDGRYPSTPAFIGPDGLEGEDEPFSYQLVGPHHYLLSVTLDEQKFSFDSREDAELVFREVRDAY